MHKKVQEFNDYRSKMNEKILASDNKVIKRIFNLDFIYLMYNHMYLGCNLDPILFMYINIVCSYFCLSIYLAKLFMDGSF